MEDRKKISLEFNLEDEKINLIDILSEDDDFLVASRFGDSPRDSFTDNAADYVGFRLSGFGNSQEVKIIQEKEQNVQTSVPFRQPRPSYLRRSLAWDNAFFDSAGVLDTDELLFINKGFDTKGACLLPGNQDVRKRRSEPDSPGNGERGSLDWFEIELFEHRGKSLYNLSKVGQGEEQLQNVQALKKANNSFLNKTTTRRKQRTTSPPKPLKALGRMKNISARSNNRNMSANLEVEMENKSATTDSRQDLVMEKKLTSQNSQTAATTSTISAPFIDGSIGASSPRASSFSKRKTKSRKSKLSSSLSATKIKRHSETSEGTINCPTSASPTSHWYSESLASSAVSNKQRSNGLNNGLDTKKTLKGSFLHNYARETSHSQSTLQSPLGSSQAMGALKPSGLRPPSPRITFFDENALHRYHGITRSRKLPQKFSSERTSFSSNVHSDCLNSKLLPHSSSSSSRRSDTACKKLRSPCLEVAVNIKRTKTDHANTFFEESKEMCLETERMADQENNSGDQLGNLSKCFEAINLNQERKQICTQSKCNKNSIENLLLDSPVASSKTHHLSLKPLMAAASTSSTRTPLADKTSYWNVNETLAMPMEPKKENLLQKASSIYTGSEAVHN